MTKVQTRREQEVPNTVARGAWEAMASKAIQKNNGGAYYKDSTHKSSYINTTKKSELDRTPNVRAKPCKLKYLYPLARRAWEATASRASQKSRGTYYKDSTHESSYINTTKKAN